MESLKTYTYGPKSSAAPRQLVILLHGLGANGQDLIGLAPYYAQALPDAIFVSPDSPFPCDMAPTGFQWFSMQEQTPEFILKGVQTAAPVVDDFMTAQMTKYNLSADKVVLGGFSQGAIMSLYVGLRYAETLAGILAYSGALVVGDDEDLAVAMKKLPVCLVHGDSDPVLPVAAYYKAKKALEEAGFSVSGGVTPGLAHGIDEAGIETGAAFLSDVLGV